MEKPITIPKELLEVGGYYLCDCKYFLVAKWDGSAFRYWNKSLRSFPDSAGYLLHKVRPYLHLNGGE